MTSAAALYTPEVLGLATSLSLYPLDEALPLRGSARSPSCGSALEIGLELTGGGLIERVGVRSHACAIGQAAAAIFAAGAMGRDRAAISLAQREVASWLAGGPEPAWPRVGAIAAGAAYPARHGAILLPWDAALRALPSADPDR